MSGTTAYTHIARDPEVCGGLPCIQGTRVRVLDIVTLHRRGLTPVEILDSYDHLTLGQVHAALAYYYDHKGEVDAQFAEIRRREDEIRQRHPDLAR